MRVRWRQNRDVENTAVWWRQNRDVENTLFGVRIKHVQVQNMKHIECWRLPNLGRTTAAVPNTRHGQLEKRLTKPPAVTWDPPSISLSPCACIRGISILPS